MSRKVRAKDEEEHWLFERDPFIYFYEDFLAKYNAMTKKSRGVYYTPPPIVNFIVRTIDDILKDAFKIKDGLADNRRVTVLDFARGTGTFLLEVSSRISAGQTPGARASSCASIC
jgi:type I restriction-modification system DNA methylase subunit